MNKSDRPVAIILGGTIPHCELIRQLKERGYYTVLIDYLNNPPAKAIADYHVQESTMDKDKVLKIAQEMNAKLVVCGCVDQANITACYVMEKLGYKPPYSYETALQITNKGVMKRVMMEKGIPTSKYVYVDSGYGEVAADLRYPVIVKPADSNSANGVKKAENEDEMKSYLAEAIKISRNSRAIIEEYVSGQEISAYCFIKDKKAKLLMVAERISVIDGEKKIIKCYSSIAPARISVTVEKEAEHIATQIAKAFDLDNTALFFQGIVNGEQIDVIEFAPRIGGGVCFKTIIENTRFDVISAIVDSWEGKEVDFSTYTKPSRLLVINTIYGKDSIFDHLEGIDMVQKEKQVVAFYQIRSKGDKIDNSKASSSRIAFFIVNAVDEEDLLRKVHNVYESVKVMDSQGNNVIREDLNLENLWGTVKMN